MKKTTSISLGKCNFIIDEDAYCALDKFLKNYKKELRTSENAASASEIEEEIEMRMAEIFKEKLCGREVVGIGIVKDTIVGMGLNFPEDDGTKECPPACGRTRRLYRDKECGKIGGVCAGLANHLDIDVTIIRVLFVLGAIFGFAGFWIYLAFWIIVPAAVTPVEKCEMYGMGATADNLKQWK